MNGQVQTPHTLDAEGWILGMTPVIATSMLAIVGYPDRRSRTHVLAIPEPGAV
jgi:hypothetical protein